MILATGDLARASRCCRASPRSGKGRLEPSGGFCFVVAVETCKIDEHGLPVHENAPKCCSGMTPQGILERAERLCGPFLANT
jgi:hypothetical protein